MPRLTAFDLAPGRVIGGKYVVERKLGGGWEGEVYKVRERKTDIVRAAKLFYPQRNVGDRAVLRYARKLERLRQCPIITQYHHSDVLRYRGISITSLISEFFDGELFSDFVKRQVGHRLTTFEALTIVHALAAGLEEIHAAKLYHGDLHSENLMVRRKGVGFTLKLIDFFHRGPMRADHRGDDVVDVVHLLYDAVGGKKRYPKQPAEIKAIVKGRRRDLILKAYPNVTRLRRHLETFTWADDPCGPRGGSRG